MSKSDKAAGPGPSRSVVRAIALIAVVGAGGFGLTYVLAVGLSAGISQIAPADQCSTFSTVSGPGVDTSTNPSEACRKALDEANRKTAP